MALKEMRWFDWQRMAIFAGSIIAFLAIWYLIAWWDDQDPAVIVVLYPHEVFSTLLSSFTSPDWRGYLMGQDSLASLGRLFLGFLLSLVIALPMGLLIGFSWIARDASKPIIELIRPIPPLAWLPVFIVIFGNSFGPIMIVFLGIFFPMLLAVVFGVKNVPKEYVEAARTLGAGKLEILRKVIIPYTVPYLMNGIYIGLGVGWMCIVAAEMMGVTGGGIGDKLWSAYFVGRYDFMYASIVMLGILGFMTTEMARILNLEVRKWMGMQEE